MARKPLLVAALTLLLAGGGLFAAAPPASAAACAPSSSTVGGDSVLTFTGSAACSWTVPAGVTAADVLVVAGGGGGSALAATLSASGGGAGGLISRTGFAVTPGSAVTVQAGAGGGGDTLGATGGVSGGNSTFGSLVALGGGGGGLLAGSAGGSGGGAGFTVLSGFAGGAGTTGQGHAGGGSTTLGVLGSGSGGSGGGAGGAASGTTPGAGLASSITGSSVTYAAGGSSLGTANATVGGGGRATASLLPVVAAAGNPGAVVVRYRKLVAPVFTASTPAGSGTVGEAFAAYTFAATGTPAPTFAVTSGALPAGLSLNGTTGVLAGTPSASGTATFRVTASNSAGSVSTGPLSVAVAAAATDPDPEPTSPPVEAPTAIAAAAGVSSFTASWSAVDGATSYTASADPGPSACTTAGTSCVLGAVAGRTYTVTVVAHTSDGDSPVSAVSNPVVPQAPMVPDSAPTTAPATLTTSRGRISETTPGEGITVIGTGFAANSTAKVIMYSTPVELGTVTTDANGRFALPTTVPQLEAGQHHFVASGVDPAGITHMMTLPVSVVAEAVARPSLPLAKGRPVVTAAAGRSKVARVPCALSSGVVARCVVTATAVIGKKAVKVGTGTLTTTSTQGLRRVSVPVKLGSRVLPLTKRPGGALVTFTAVVTQRGKSATKTVTRTGRVEARSYALAHWVHFNAGATKVTRAEGRYLESVRSKITGATRVSCTGHAAESTRARSVAAATKRATAACAALTKNSRARTVIRTVVERSARKATATARARQRRVDVTITN